MAIQDINEVPFSNAFDIVRKPHLPIPGDQTKLSADLGPPPAAVPQSSNSLTE